MEWVKVRLVAVFSIIFLLLSCIVFFPNEIKVRAYELTVYIDEYDDSSKIAESNYINFGLGNISLTVTETSWTVTTQTDFSVGRFNNTIVQSSGIMLPKTTQPSSATELDVFAAENVTGAGAVCTDGTYIYAKRWGGYSGNNTFAKIGTGFNGTERGKNYGFINPPVNYSLTVACFGDGYIYNGRTANISGNFCLERQEIATGNRSYVYLPPGVGLLVRYTGEIGASTEHLITTDGRYFYCLAYKFNGSTSYNGYKFIVLDPFDGWNLVRTVYVETPSYYVDGIIADGECIYPIQWTGGTAAKITRIDAVTGEVYAQWTIYQQYTVSDPISGQYDYVNNRVYLGELTKGIIHEYMGKRESNNGTYTSAVHYAGELVNWRELDFTANLQPGTNVTGEVRAGNFSKPVVDTFDLDNNWTVVSGEWHVNNGVYNNSDSSLSILVRNDLVLEDYDYGLEVNVREVSTNIGSMGIAFRVQDADNCYLFYLTGSYAKLFRRVSGINQQITAVPFAWSADTWYTLGVEALGNNLKCYINGVLVISMFDPLFQNGSIGLFSNGAIHEFDNASVKIMEWSAWSAQTESPVYANLAGMYGQFRIHLSADAAKYTPIVDDATLIKERYDTEGYIISLPYSPNKNIMTATCNVIASVPEGTSISLTISNDYGQTWEDTMFGTLHVFSSIGTGFQYRLELTSNGARTPIVDCISVDLESNTMPQSPQLWTPMNNTWLNTSTPELKCQPAVDPDGDVLTYRFYVSRSLDFVDVIDSGWIEYPNWTTPQLEDGKWYWRACAYDSHLISPMSEPYTLIIDTHPPTVSVPIDDGIYSTTEQVRFSWNRGEDPTPYESAIPSGIKGYYIRITTGPVENETNFVKMAYVDTNEYRFPNGQNGVTYYASVCAVDKSNNIGPWSGVSDGITVDISVPKVEGARTNATRYYPSKTITWAWNASTDYPSGIAGYYVWVWSGGTDLVTDYFTTELSYTFDNCTDGKTYYAKVRAVDNAGNTGDYCTAEYGVTVDTTPPEPVTVTDSGRYTNNPGAFSIEWSKSIDAESGITRYEYCLGTAPGLDDVVSWRNATPTQQSVRLTGLSLKDGVTYYATVCAVNGAGIRSSLSSSDGLTVDTTPPKIEAIYDGGEVSNIGTIVFSWNATDEVSGIVGYTVCVGTTEGGNNVISNRQTTNTSLELKRAKNGETYYISVQAVDGAGNKCVPEYSDGILVNTVRCAITTDFGGKSASGKITITGVSSVENSSIQEVHYTLDKKDWALAYGTEYWSVKLNTLSLKNGNHTIRVRATDGITFSEIVEFNFNVKNVAQSEDTSLNITLILLFVVILFAIFAFAKVQNDKKKRENAQVIIISLDNEPPSFPQWQQPHGQPASYQKSAYQQLPQSFVDPYSQNVYASQYFGDGVKINPSYSGISVAGQYFGSESVSVPHAIPVAKEVPSYSHSLSVSGVPQFCYNCRGLIKPGLVAVKCVCGTVYHDICAERRKVCDCGHTLPKRSELKKIAQEKKEEKKAEPEYETCPGCKGKVKKGPVVECSCGAKYHIACARDAEKCICGKRLDVTNMREVEKEKTKALKTETCATCNGAIKQGVAIFRCSCGLVHHITCAGRKGVCKCGRTL